MMNNLFDYADTSILLVVIAHFFACFSAFAA